MNVDNALANLCICREVVTLAGEGWNTGVS